ncbi:hypothetical protein [Brevundimonas vesicularis]|uniref:hypothetical protein n=1 Tax=Brevundimonas vesicularis TaxID=41276 RepID=UPI0028AA3413|nr:hypothetical protein [Brevundimonas vesicularis]
MDRTYNLNGGFIPTAKRSADLEGADYYPTPAWATRALIENERFDGSIWEPACGDGSMSEVISAAGYEVYSSDLYDRGYGEVGIDYLSSDRRADNIITNPPYNSAEGFVRKSLLSAERKFALLLRLAFLEGANRQKTIFNIAPPATVWVFSERITFYQSGAQIKGSGTTAYAWFVWDNLNTNRITELKWIPLGYKSSTRRDQSQQNPMLFK